MSSSFLAIDYTANFKFSAEADLIFLNINDIVTNYLN